MKDVLKAMFEIAKKTIIDYITKRDIPSLSSFSFPKKLEEKLKEKAGVFVTLEKDLNGKHELRGCIGYPYPLKEVWKATIESAIEASTNDPRFSPVSEDELNDLYLEVSLLTPPVEIKESSWQGKLKEIDQGIDGIILKYKYYSSLFLPQVWKELPDKEEFLAHLSLKAGLHPHTWKLRESKLYKFQVYSIKDKLMK